LLDRGCDAALDSRIFRQGGLPILRLRPRATFGGSAVALVVLLCASAAAQRGGPSPVVVAPLVEREIPATVRLVGTVRPERRSVVAAETSGIVATFVADEGQSLQGGEVIATLDGQVAELKLEEAKALLGGHEAKLAELEAGTREEQLRRQRALVDEAQAIFEKWKHEYERVQVLSERSQSNEKERHDTEMEFRAAERRLAQCTADLDMWTNGPRKEEIAKARHDAAAQRAVTQRLARDLEKTTIRAPFDGFVVSKRTEVGEWLEAGGAVCELVAIGTVKVRADAPEATISFARPGAPASVEIEAIGRSRAATVSRVIPLAMPAARTFPVEIDLPNPDHTLLPGMFVWVNVPCGPPGKRLMVSKDAIVSHGGSKQVYVVRTAPPSGGGKADRNGAKESDGVTKAPAVDAGPPASGPGAAAPVHTAMPIAVTTGLEIGNEIEVQASGLSAGDLVVVRANERLFGPTPVIPVPNTTEQASRK
jgi:HlyD family secretion protein